MALTRFSVFNRTRTSLLAALTLACGSSFLSAQIVAPLPAKVQDGVIFDAWGWSLANIQANLGNIASAGYNAIQISPIQGHKSGTTWYLYYQPTNFTIGNDLGDRTALQTLCTTAANTYGIKIIVDAVLNQCADDAPNGDISPQMDPLILANQQAWFHRNSDGSLTANVSDWTNRSQVTQGRIGTAADYNTQNVDLQNLILAYLNDCIAVGVAGFRFDAAKSIETTRGDDAGQSYNGGANNFWDTILPKLTTPSMFLYGEVLADGGDNNAGYEQLFRTGTARSVGQVNTAIQTQNVTDLRVIHHDVDSVPAHNYDEDPTKIVVYIENWDNYNGSVGINTNDSSQSVFTNTRSRILGNAMLTARASMVNIVFSRPSDTAPFDPMLVAVNKFRNAVVGQGEYLRFPSNSILMVERGTKGAVLVNVSTGSQAVDTPTNVPAGTYTDQGSTGAVFQVTNGVLTGTIPASSAVTLYNAAAATVPVPPAGVVATAASASQINLTWTASPGAASYTVYCATTSAGPFTSSVGTSTTASFSSTGLAASTTYYYQVSATNTAGKSANSATASATTPVQGPLSNFPTMYLRGTMNATVWDTSMPMTLVSNYTWQRSATLAANTAYTFKFDTGTWATGQNWGAGGTAGVGVVNSSTDIPYTAGAAGSYLFQFNDSTLAYKITAPAPAIPVPPASVAATAASSSQINLTWTASAGAASYTVYRAATSAGPFTTSAGTSTTASFASTGLAAGTAYYYQVSATSAAGTSANSATATATTLPAAPAPVTGLAAVAASSSQINLTWTAMAGATSYTVFRAATSAGPFTSVGTSTTSSFSSTGLAASTAYYFQVAASNSGGSSANSATATATTLPGSTFLSTYPKMYLRGTMSATIWDTSMPMALAANYTWKYTVNLAASTVYTFKFDASGAWTSGQEWGGSGTGAAGTGVANGGNLSYTSGAAGSYTFTFVDNTLAYAIVAPGVVVPAAPTSLAATAASSTQVNLTWTASAGATSYTIYRATSSTGPFTTSVGTSATASFASTGLTAGTTYYYEVSASNAAGASANSTPASAATKFASNYAGMYLRGTENAWGATAMALVANNTWKVSVTLTPATSYQFKFEIGGGTTWSTNWGNATSSTTSASSGTASLSSSYNLYYTTGTATGYTFTFNDATRAFTITAP